MEGDVNSPSASTQDKSKRYTSSDVDTILATYSINKPKTIKRLKGRGRGRPPKHHSMDRRSLTATQSSEAEIDSDMDTTQPESQTTPKINKQPSTFTQGEHVIHSTQLNFVQDSAQDNQLNLSNFSTKTKSLLYTKLKYIAYLTSNSTSRIQLAEHWEKNNPNTSDIIIKTSKGFIIKSNTNPEDFKIQLNSLVNDKIIENFSVSDTNAKQTLPNPSLNSTANQSFSVVIATVEPEISDEVMINHLKLSNYTIRFCKRITSRATGKATSLMRIITSCASTFEKLLNEGVYFKYKHYPVFPSKPPPPLPVACGKCNNFDHITANCNAQIKCNKCQGNHPTVKCTSPLPIKCMKCNTTDHVPWSTKCPQHQFRALHK